MDLQLLPLLERDDTVQQSASIKHSFKLFAFKNVKNGPEILQRIKSGDRFPNCTVLNADRIYSKYQLQIACTKACHNYDNAIARSKSLYVEIMLCVSPTVSISDALKNFGLNKESRHLFVIIEAPQDSAIESELKGIIDGELVPVPSFNDADMSALTRIYSLSDSRPVEGQILSAMAVQGL